MYKILPKTYVKISTLPSLIEGNQLRVIRHYKRFIKILDRWETEINCYHIISSYQLLAAKNLEQDNKIAHSGPNSVVAITLFCL